MAWPLILREEHRLRVFENWMLLRMFGTKRAEISIVSTKQRVLTLTDQQILEDDQISRLRRTRHIARTGAEKDAYWLWVAKT